MLGAIASCGTATGYTINHFQREDVNNKKVLLGNASGFTSYSSTFTSIPSEHFYGINPRTGYGETCTSRVAAAWVGNKLTQTQALGLRAAIDQYLSDLTSIGV